MAGIGMNNSMYYNPTVTPQPVYGYSPSAIRPFQNSYEPIYVTGIEGANAFQMPPGVQQMILWDADKDSFYVKKLDEMGRPRVVAWKDFSDHVEPDVQAKPQVSADVDMSVYPTRKDLEEMLEKYDMTKYLTKDDFAKMLNHLYVGERGRIVLNELDQ